MNAETRLQFIDKSIYVSFYAIALEKGINPSLVSTPLAMGK